MKRRKLKEISLWVFLCKKFNIHCLIMNWLPNFKNLRISVRYQNNYLHYIKYPDFDYKNYGLKVFHKSHKDIEQCKTLKDFENHMRKYHSKDFTKFELFYPIEIKLFGYIFYDLINCTYYHGYEKDEYKILKIVPNSL